MLLTWLLMRLLMRQCEEAGQQQRVACRGLAACCLPQFSERFLDPCANALSLC